METFCLVCHPDTPAKSVSAVTVEVDNSGDAIWFRFVVDCQLDSLNLPGPLEPERTDGLWQSTCFEAFIGGENYSEFNFSPTHQWAAYDFTGYRAGMAARNLSLDPEIGLDASEEHFALEASIDLDGLAGKLALSAVIEEVDGTKSYWALAHPPGAPDFHHPACFAASLPAPRNP